MRSLNGYIRYVRQQAQGRQEYGDHVLREVPPIYVLAPELPEE